MNNNSGVNRIFLLGQVKAQPRVHILNENRFLAFQLTTTEDIRKGLERQVHSEVHQIKIAGKMMDECAWIQAGDLVYIQGRIQTRVVFEDQVKLYRTEIIVTMIEPVNAANVDRYNDAIVKM